MKEEKITVTVGSVVQFKNAPADSKEAWIVFEDLCDGIVAIQEVTDRSLKVERNVEASMLKVLF